MDLRTYGVIMAGGSGTRFWPLSRREKPKQFLKLTGDDTMLKVTLDRIEPIIAREDVYIVTGSDMVQLTESSLGADSAKVKILAEPAARNTAACIGYAAMEIVKHHGDGIMVILASDHHIRDEEGFRTTVEKGIEAAKEGDALVTIGIKPTSPATGYGYIRRRGSGSREVMEFVEKPDEATARRYLESGEYLWNSGMFIWKASVILDRMKELLPDVYAPLCEMGAAMGTGSEREVIERVYPEIPKISIDYGIMERSKGILVMEGDFGWSDVGSLDALAELWIGDEEDNHVRGEAVLMDCEGTIINGGSDRLAAVIGMKDVMVIDTKDVLLVCPKSRAQDVKMLLEGMDEASGEKYF